MTTEDKLMRMRCQLLLKKAQVEKSILIDRAKLQQSYSKVAETNYSPIKRSNILFRQWLDKISDIPS
ncbi:hypothetical protein DPMN_133000 [Dreissena polymorpha]|uniref:Uncharacterized protein n=1 Tax=Dreissena polymorpha TaxID=45954 RepID=A0A9D4JEC8_DREPO|nr:hypothetical protein DPMN_133000 [Dreissena polymorpha]